MKKALLVLFAVLMLFAFVGCDNSEIDSKVEDNGNPTEDFIETYEVMRKIASGFPRDAIMLEEGETEKRLEIDFSTKGSDGDQIVLIWFAGFMDEEDAQLLNYKATGKVVFDTVLSETKGCSTVSIEGVEVDFTYKSEDLTLDSKLRISGIITETVSESMGGKVESLIVNDVAFNDIVFSYKHDNYMPIGFSSATCDGKDVNLDILNAANFLC